MNWIQKHALGVLMRADTVSLKQMKPDGVDSNLFSYHIHYLKSNDIIESIARGRYRLTTKGMYVVGKFNVSTGKEAKDAKTVIVLYARRDNEILLFKWSRHPYFGVMTLPHDRYNFGKSLQEALAEAVNDKLGLTIEQATPVYRKSGMIHIYHDSQQISCMSAHVYEVSPQHIKARPLRNGALLWVAGGELAALTDAAMGLPGLIAQIADTDTHVFEATLSY